MSSYKTRLVRAQAVIRLVLPESQDDLCAIRPGANVAPDATNLYKNRGQEHDCFIRVDDSATGGMDAEEGVLLPACLRRKPSHCTTPGRKKNVA